MDVPTSDNQIKSTSEAPSAAGVKKPHAPTRTPAIIVGVVAVLVIGLSFFYLMRPGPLLVQGEADATRFDIAARVDGRARKFPSSAARTFRPAQCWCGSAIPRPWPSSSR